MHYYESPLPAFSITFQSWDTANKASELNDYSVCTTWGIHDGHYYLIEVFRAKLEYPDLKRMAITLQKKHNAHKVVIEDKASGTQLIQELRHEIAGRIDHYDPPSKSDKTMRVYAQTSLFEAGKVLFPSSAPWLAELERELLSFPGAKFDDQVDSIVQALDYATRALAGISTWVTLGKERRYAQ